MQYVELLRKRPIAIETATANEQHYEVGTGVLEACLGPRMKYSSCLYPKGSETLAQAEIAMLETYVQKAQLKDGMSILDLGYVHRSLMLQSFLNIKLDVVGDLERCTLLKFSQTPKSLHFRTLEHRRSTSIPRLRRKV
jgi:cyclopropane fatty-acyl-phospholipid synthase-like methyltransferase